MMLRHQKNRSGTTFLFFCVSRPVSLFLPVMDRDPVYCRSLSASARLGIARHLTLEVGVGKVIQGDGGGKGK